MDSTSADGEAEPRHVTCHTVRQPARLHRQLPTNQNGLEDALALAPLVNFRERNEL